MSIVKTRRKIIAEAIKEMTFGELIDLAEELQAEINVPWRRWNDDAHTKSDLAAELFQWANSFGGDRGQE